MSAFEADRFNRSRTSPENSSQLSVLGSQSNLPLASASKERLQQLCTSARQHATRHFHLMIEAGMVQHLHHGMNRSRFGAVSAVDQPLEPGMHHGPGTHRTRFNCNKEFAVSQAMVAYGGTGLAQGDNLCVGRRIRVDQVAVPALAYNFVVTDDDGPDWHLASIQRALGGAESFLHPEFVRVAGCQGKCL